MNPEKIDQIVKTMDAQLAFEGYGKDDRDLILACLSAMMLMFIATNAPLRSECFIKAIELVPVTLRLLGEARNAD